MKIAFANAIKANYEGPLLADDRYIRTTLFDNGWDGELVYTDIRTVTDNMINGGLVAGYIAPGIANFPEVVPLEASLARKDGRRWKTQKVKIF